MKNPISEKVLDVSAADLLSTHLIEQGCGTSPVDELAFPLFSTYLPDSPVDAIVCFTTAARKDGRLQKGIVIEHPGFQVRLRGNDYDTLFAKGVDILDAIDETKNAVVFFNNNTYCIRSITRESNLLPLGKDVDGGFHEFTINGTMTIQKALA